CRTRIRPLARALRRVATDAAIRGIAPPRGRPPSPMSDPKPSALSDLARAAGTRAERARQAARLVRLLGGYRWVGLYDVSATEISVVAWDGPEGPAHPRFNVTQGLNGAAVAKRAPVIVQDVASDPRYLETITGTRGEMIYPVLGPSGVVIGTLDVESDRVNAFSSLDETLVAACAQQLGWLWDQPDR